MSGFDLRLMGAGWIGTPLDANQTWANESLELWARADALVKADPVSAAMLSAKLTGTHGSMGLTFRSLVDVEQTGEGDLRDQIETVISEASEGTALDAAGMMCRREIDEALDRSATIAGECFAVYSWLPDRPWATTSGCWRIIRRDRVKNPPGESNSPRLFEGIKLDKSGAPLGIWIAPVDPMLQGRGNPREGWQFVPWYAANGMQTVIHRIGQREPGAYRGLSMYAPNLGMAKQIKGALDAYVIAKRIQACHPIFVKCEDPAAAARADRNGAVWGPNTALEPGKTYYLGPDAEVTMPSFTFQGSDLREFLDTLYRNQFAAWGMPIDVVLAQLGETNMAASRSAWLQYYRQCDRWQNDHIAQVSKPMDAAIVAEAIATGRIKLPAGMTLRQAMQGRYIRPPRSMPDPLKEAAAVEKWAQLGRDLSGLWAESGVDFRESVTQRAEDDAWMAEYGVGMESEDDAADPEDDAEDADEPADKEEKEDAPDPAAPADE